MPPALEELGGAKLCRQRSYIRVSNTLLSYYYLKYIGDRTSKWVINQGDILYLRLLRISRT